VTVNTTAAMLVVLPFLAALAHGAAIAPRQSASQVVRLASVENVAVRANGQILATNMNSANLYSIDPVAKSSTTALTISGASGLSGIGEYAPDTFAVIGGKAIYKVDFTTTPPRSTLIKTISEANNLNGLCTFDNTSVLVADAGAGLVFKLDVNTGAHSVVLQDPTMAPTGIPFGIDGIKYRDGVVWYTNIFRNSFHSVAVDPVTAKATAAVKTHWTNLMGDDLCFGPNGKIYVTTNGRNSLVEVDPAAAGQSKSVASVTGSTSCAFGRGEGDANVAYVGAGQGVFAVTIRV
jgi:streptogramin lyase